MEEKWVAFLDRQQRTILSRLGAGRTPSFDLYNHSRWSRECVAQTGAASETAERFSRQMQEALIQAYDPRTPVQAAKAVFADFRSRLGVEWVDGEIAPSPERAGDHIVYKLFDGAKRLLYVGITSRGPQRLVEHHRTKSWFGDVEHILFERFTTREKCAAREVALIRELHPTFNVQHNQASQYARARN